MLLIIYIYIQVNNAAVSYNDIGENSVERAETVMKTNYFGAKLLTQALLPFFRRSSSSSRILNLTSRLGSLDVSSLIYLLTIIKVH